MGEQTAIEWATHTFNPWIGCAKVAEGCTHCYAESYAKRYGKAQWGVNGTRVKTSEAYWRQPHAWNRKAAEWQDAYQTCPLPGEERPARPRVFCASLADVFEDWGGDILNSRGEVMMTDSPTVLTGLRPIEMADLRRDLFALIDATPSLDWLLLTKRPENIRKMWPKWDNGEVNTSYRQNVWLLTSIATQEDADKNVPELLKCRDLTPVLGLSCEPLLGPLDLRTHLGIADNHEDMRGLLHWVIVGGESGAKARKCETQWVRSVVRQCQASAVPAFVKQLGSKPGTDHRELDCEQPQAGGRLILKDRKGGDINEFPEDLRVREFPTALVQPTEAP